MILKSKKSKVESLTKRDVDNIRDGMKNQRICMSEDGMIFAPTLEDIKKHGYRPIEDIPMSEFGLDDPALNPKERKQ